MKFYNLKNKSGFAMVEIVVGSAIILVAILAINQAYSAYVQYALANSKNAEAGYILEEGMEALKFIRDKGWTANISKLSTTTTYYLTWNASGWATTTTPQYVDGVFLRSVTVSDVKRDAVSDDIAVSGYYDSGTKLITTTVAYWQGHATTTRSLSLYLANKYNY